MKFRPPDWSLRQLQYALAVEETGGFRRAAERCLVSQPALSSQLALLEEALGARIFERGSRRILVTASGRILLEQARRVLIAAEELTSAAARLGDPLTASLRVGVIPTLSPYLVPELVGPLRVAFPSLQIIWHEAHTKELRALLESGDLDAAVVALESDLGEVDTEALGQDAFLLAVPPEHPLAARSAAVRLDDLLGETVLLLEDGHCLRDQTLRFCGDKMAAESGVRATSLSTLAQMVAGGAGATVLPRLALASENRHGRLVIRPFTEAPFRTVGLVWRGRSPLRAALRRLAAEMRASLSTLLDAAEPRAAVEPTQAALTGRIRARRVR
jgi:LysR family transcriptional regulator, hydrogen peroxide-inducible genes activator